VTAVDDSARAAAGSGFVPRAERVAEAVTAWTDELATLGGRDPLLTFRDLKTGTLDLAAAEPEARKKLLDGEPVPVTRLFPHEPLRGSALRTVHAIRDKARELAEERGIVTCLLAVGIATWADPFAAHRPTAPVLVRPASVKARDPAETDFVIEFAEEPEVNPVLLHALDAQLGLRFEPDDLRDPAGELRYPVVVERMREFAPAHVIDGFSIAHRAVLGTFAREPLALARDLVVLGPELARSDVVAALAGDPDALAATPRAAGRAGHLVHDADSAQETAVAVAGAGGHLRIDAPPGTGRTQTIANLVAELVARGQKVLVVGQKPAALHDLVARMRSVGLDDLVMDLSGGRTGSPDPVRRVAETARQLADETARRLADDRREATPHRPTGAEALQEYCDALHRTREPWGSSAYDALMVLVEVPAEARTAARIPVDTLRTMSPQRLETLRRHLREYAELDGLALAEDDSPWYGSTVRTEQEAGVLAATVASLRERQLPALRDSATRAAVEVGLTGPRTTQECFAIVDLLNAVVATEAQFAPEIWSAPLDDMVTATADRRWRTTHGSQVGLLARRRLRREARDLVATKARPDRERLHRALLAARDQLSTWRERSRDNKSPRFGEHLLAGTTATAAVSQQLAVLVEANPRTADLAQLPFAEIGQRLAALAADEVRLAAIPRLTKLEAEFSDAGLDEMLAELRARGVGATEVVSAFEYTRHAAMLEAWRYGDAALRDFDPQQHEARIGEFRASDRQSQPVAADAVRAARAEQFGRAAEDNEGQALVVESGESGPRTARELLMAAPDVTLATVPCWVMSPLAVATALPARRLFDVVVVDDAGRLAVAHAVPAIARASRIVLVGDDQQLTTTAFTTTVEPEIESDDAGSSQADPENPSVLEALDGRLLTLALRTQYRTRDDRLFAFPARTAYRGRIATVPGVRGASRLRHELIDTTGEGDDPIDSTAAEVARVVELVLEHARSRSYESLGVVTLGSRHARRIDDALRRALVRAPDVATFVHEDREEPFFVKDVSRAGGDVRDAVIMSVGYGRSTDGRVLYRFGALDRPGGERRLTAAITAARERVTLVSSFTSGDLSPRRLTTAGAQALRDFLVYVESSGEPAAGDDVTADALEAAIAARLRADGVEVVVGHGSGPGRVAVAARHPARRDRLVLAVETDGPAYAAVPTPRERDRLRPEHLSRLGWAVHRVWAPAWSADPDREAERLLAAYAEAVTYADAYDWAEAAADADVVVGMPEPSDGTVPDASEDAADRGVDRGRRPPVATGRPIGTYTRRELAALARWIDSDGLRRSEADAIAALAAELSVEQGPRVDDALRHAVRVARAGAPSLWLP